MAVFELRCYRCHLTTLQRTNAHGLKSFYLQLYSSGTHKNITKERRLKSVAFGASIMYNTLKRLIASNDMALNEIQHVISSSDKFSVEYDKRELFSSYKYGKRSSKMFSFQF